MPSTTSLERIIKSGLPFVTRGRLYFVDYGTQGAGADLPNANVFKTIAAAYKSMRAGYGDTIVLLDSGATGGMDRETATLAWNLADTHLVGSAFGTMGENRVSIRALAGNNFTPLINVSADGCSMWNIGTFHGYAAATAQICMQVSAGRCKFVNCGFQGIGSAANPTAGSASLYLHNAFECEFTDCLTGLTTIAMPAAGQQILIDGNSYRNRFVNGRVECMASNANDVFVRVPAGQTLDRYIEFKNTVFFNCINSTATTMTNAMAVDSAAGCTFMFPKCEKLGATNWVNGGVSQANVYVPNANGVLAVS